MDLSKIDLVDGKEPTSTHNYTRWIENEFISGNCGLVLKREITKKNELGFGFRGTHALPSQYVPKKKGAIRKKPRQSCGR